MMMRTRLSWREAIGLAGFLALACDATVEGTKHVNEAAPGTEGSETSTSRGPRWPVEVIGICAEQEVQCARTTLTIDLPAPPTTQTKLRITLHNIVSESSADMTINGSRTVALSTRGEAPLRVQGGVSIAEITLAADELKAGKNTFSFGYAPTTEGVSGYRIIDLVALVEGQSFRPELDADDIAAWTAPSNDIAAIERGRRFFADESRDGGPTCATCHVDNGADFEYFAFSNASIVDRAMFHEFSQRESEDIATYLRSIDVERIGTLIDPPFQPGPGNRGAAGAGWDQVVDDDALGQAAFGVEGIPSEIAWDFAKDIDFYALPAPLQVPSWFRWLPRELETSWITRPVRAEGETTTVQDAAKALHDSPSYANAWRLNSAAFATSRELRAEAEHFASIQVIRFAAVKLWEWSRLQGFDRDHHGFPDEETDEAANFAPAYPYEVGFAFFETARDGGRGIPEAWKQAIEWWWVQLAVHDGRGRSSQLRPLNFADVIEAADEAGLGPNAITLLYLYGSFEESRSPEFTELDIFGTGQGSVRYFGRVLDRLEDQPDVIVALWKRLLRHQVTWLEEKSGRELNRDHLTSIEAAWTSSTANLPAASLDELRAIAAPEVRDSLK